MHYLILRFYLFLFFALITSPVLFLLMWLMDYLDDHEALRMLRWAVVPVVLAWLFGVPWLTRQAAQYMALENRTFLATLRWIGYDLRLRLAFLPVIGHWLEPNTDKRESNDDNAQP